ncbi:hypothetical protein AAFF_G00238860 [Aldrovandia affinis]|uniref:Uncharacterized protein n=1 Tax=Aldrovandia affinis TaxID=143900 RepID=A0AAD7W3Y7_9TELE|nr:hypothetical protein AAFF_G00238860 [Aldrovandia affinis]
MRADHSNALKALLGLRTAAPVRLGARARVGVAASVPLQPPPRPWAPRGPRLRYSCADRRFHGAARAEQQSNRHPNGGRMSRGTSITTLVKDAPVSSARARERGEHPRTAWGRSPSPTALIREQARPPHSCETPFVTHIISGALRGPDSLCRLSHTPPRHTEDSEHICLCQAPLQSRPCYLQPPPRTSPRHAALSQALSRVPLIAATKSRTSSNSASEIQTRCPLPVSMEIRSLEQDLASRPKAEPGPGSGTGLSLLRALGLDALELPLSETHTPTIPPAPLDWDQLNPPQARGRQDRASRPPR